MIQYIQAADRHYSDFGWLQTYWLFSFSDYFDPANVNFGPLRVFNDDIVQAGGGFPTHPHREMEIVTVVLQGEVTHHDSMGNASCIKTGDVQRMSAGTGLTHSEFNRAAEPVHFCQIWFHPRHKGLSPSYDQKSFPAQAWQGQLLPIASGLGHPGAVSMDADAVLYRTELAPQSHIFLKEISSQRIFVYLISGRILVNEQELSAGMQARIHQENTLSLQAKEAAELIAIAMPEP